MHAAVRAGKAANLKLLLARGADPLAQGTGCVTPLHVAITSGAQSEHVFDVLLDALEGQSLRTQLAVRTAERDEAVKQRGQARAEAAAATAERDRANQDLAGVRAELAALKGERKGKRGRDEVGASDSAPKRGRGGS